MTSSHITTCGNNGKLERIGCGSSYGGRQVHCTLPAPWSEHPDGLCHETFGAYSTWDHHAVIEGTGDLPHHTKPSEVSKSEGRITLRQDERGVWHVHDDNNPFIPWETGT